MHGHLEHLERRTWRVAGLKTRIPIAEHTEAFSGRFTLALNENFHRPLERSCTMGGVDKDDWDFLTTSAGLAELIRFACSVTLVKQKRSK